MFLSLKALGLISQKELYVTYEFKKSNNLGKLYFLPKRISVVPGGPVIFNCGTPTEEASVVTGRPVIPNCVPPTEKASEFVDFHLKPKMRGGPISGTQVALLIKSKVSTI